METRAKNANEHPGALVAKRKRRTKAEMEAARAEAQALKDSIVEQHNAKVQALAALETRIDNANDDTPRPTRPRPRPKPLALRRTESYIDQDMFTDEEGHQVNDRTSDLDFVAEASEGGDTDVEEESRVKKKAKDVKPKVRDEVDMARKQVAKAGGGKGEGEESGHNATRVHRDAPDTRADGKMAKSEGEP
jgi:hypothetical protein